MLPSSEEPRSMINPASLALLADPAAPSLMSMIASLISELVVCTEVVVPLTVKLPLSTRLVPLTSPVKEAPLRLALAASRADSAARAVEASASMFD